MCVHLKSVFLWIFFALFHALHFVSVVASMNCRIIGVSEFIHLTQNAKNREHQKKNRYQCGIGARIHNHKHTDNVATKSEWENEKKIERSFPHFYDIFPRFPRFFLFIGFFRPWRRKNDDADNFNSELVNMAFAFWLCHYFDIMNAW